MRFEFDGVSIGILGLPDNVQAVCDFSGHCDLGDHGFPADIHIDAVEHSDGIARVKRVPLRYTDPLYSRLAVGILVRCADRIKETLEAEKPQYDHYREHAIGPFEAMGVRNLCGN